MTAEDATPLIDALLEVIAAAQAYLPGEIETDVFVTRVLQAVDNPRIIAALAAHGYPVSAVE